MAKNVETYTLNLNVDTSNAIKNYQALLNAMQAQGGDSKQLESFSRQLNQIQQKFNELNMISAEGFTNSKDIQKAQASYDKLFSSLNILNQKMVSFNKEASNYPFSEYDQANIQIQKLGGEIQNLQKLNQKGLTEGLQGLGYSEKDAKNLTNIIKTQDQLNAKLQEEIQRRKDLVVIQKQQMKSDQRQAAKVVAEENPQVISRENGMDMSSMTNYLKSLNISDEDVEEVVANINHAIARGISLRQNSDEIQERIKSELEFLSSSLDDANNEIEFDILFDENNYIKLKNALDDIVQYRYTLERELSYNSTQNYEQSVSNLNLLSDNGKDTFNQDTINVIQQYADYLDVIAEKEESLKNIGDSLEELQQQQTIEMQNNSEAINDAASETERYRKNVNAVTTSAYEASVSQEQLNKSFDQFSSQAKRIFSVSGAYQTLRRVIKETFSDIQDLDKAFSSIAMVTSYSVADMWETYDQYADMALELGQTTTAVIESSALFYQQGLDTNDALELTTQTMKLATLAGIDYSTATSEMTAALRGFNMEMQEGSTITDVYSNLAANAAASVEEIATAMTKTAAIASNAGMSYENTAAYLTKMIETTQESADSVGTSLKTIIANFTQMRTAISSDDADAELNINSVDEALKSVGISLRDSTGQIKNLDDVIDELGQSWSTLDRNTQRYLATTIAGTRQQSRLIALLDDYERTIELEQEAQDSAGQSDLQFSKYADTVEYRLNQLNTEWEKFRTSLINSDFIKGALDVVISFMNALNNLPTSVIITLGGALVVFGKKIITSVIEPVKSLSSIWGKLVKQVKNKISVALDTSDAKEEMFNVEEDYKRTKEEIENNPTVVKVETENPSQNNSSKNINEQQESIDTLDKTKSAADNAGDAMDGLKESNDKEGKSAKEASKNQDELNKSLDDNTKKSQTSRTAIVALTGVIAMATEAFSGANSSVILLTGATTAFTIVIQALSAGLDALNPALLGIALGIIAVSAAIAGISYGYKEWKSSKPEEILKAQQQSFEDLGQSIQEANNDFKELKETESELEDIADTYDEISSKIYLTEEEQEKYNELINEIQSDFPELIKSYDEVTGKVTLWTNELQKQLSLLREETTQAQRLASVLSLTSAMTNEDILENEANTSAGSSSFTEDSLQTYTTYVMNTNSDYSIGEAISLASNWIAGYYPAHTPFIAYDDLSTLDYLINNQNVEYEKLNEEAQKLLTANGISEDNWSSDIQSLDKKSYQNFIEALKSAISFSNYLDNESISKDIADVFDKLDADLTEMTYQEVLNAVDKVNRYYGDYADDILSVLLGDETYNNLDQIPGFLGQYLSDDNKDILNSLTMGVIENIGNVINSMLSAGLSDEAIKQYTNSVVGLDLTDEQLSTVLGFDWSSYSSSFSARSYFVEAMESLGMTKSQAQELYDTIINLQEESGVYQFKITSSVALESNFSDFRDEVESAVSDIDVSLNIVDIAFSDDISPSDLNDYRSSLLDAGYTEKDWWNTFSFDNSGNVKMNYNAIGDMFQQSYDTLYNDLVETRRNAYQGMLEQEQILENMKEEEEGYAAQLQQYEELRDEYYETDWAKQLSYLDWEFLSEINSLLDDQEVEIDDLSDALSDAQEKLKDAIESLNEAIENLNELLYGSSERKSSLDTLYNYTTAINAYENQAERYLSAFTDTQDIDKATTSWEKYASSQHDAIAMQKAEQEVLKQGLNNIANWVNNATSTYSAVDENGNTQTVTVNYRDYVTFDETTGRMQIDQQLLNLAQFNDDFKDLLEQNVQDYNSYMDNLENIGDSILEAQQELYDQREQILEDYGDLESNVADILKDKYQEEVDALKEKYSQMEDADSEYLSALRDAIDKQRNLRDLENNYEDLAQQERRLSLMQRDTSGTRQTDVLEAQNDLEETRQDLLDEAVDNILDGMEEANDNLADIRDTELEIKQAILDDDAFWNKAAESIVASFDTVEDYAAWMCENSTEYLSATVTQQETLLAQYLEDGEAIIQKWAMDNNQSIEDYCIVASDEVQALLETTSESFTSETDRAFAEVTQQVLDDIADAEDVITDAQKEVEEAKQALSDAQEAYDKAKESLENFTKAVNNLTISTEEGTDFIENEPYASNVTSESTGSNSKSTNSSSSPYLTPSDLESSSLGKFSSLPSNAQVREDWRKTISNGTPHYATGGLVDYTGPAWVDGTKNKPEAFLSSEDTERIRRAAEIFTTIPSLNSSSSAENITDASVNYGDTQIEINLNIDSIGSNADIDYMIQRMKDEIVDVASPIGSQVILQKSY